MDNGQLRNPFGMILKSQNMSENKWNHFKIVPLLTQSLSTVNCQLSIRRSRQIPISRTMERRRAGQGKDDHRPGSSRLGCRHCRPRLGRPPCGLNSNFPICRMHCFFLRPAVVQSLSTLRFRVTVCVFIYFAQNRQWEFYLLNRILTIFYLFS